MSQSLAILLFPLISTSNAAPAEISGTWRGSVEALVVDSLQSGTSRTRFFLHTSDDTLELQGAETTLHAGQMVEVTGRVSGRQLTTSHVAATDSQPAANSCPVTGDQKAAIILVSFPSKALLSSVTPALVKASFFGTGRTVDTFLRESSFGQTRITGNVLGPYVLDADYFDEPVAIRDAALRAAAPFTNLTQYNRIFVVAPQSQSGMDSGGMALIGCGQISSSQGEFNASSMWMGAESMVGQNEIVDIASHELGHGFGLEHSRFADYGTDVLGPAGQTPAPWDGIHEYGDSYSNMGRFSAQWPAPQKALLGWLQPGSNIRTVTTAGNFTLSPYELPGSNQVLRISRDSTGNDWLWLEYRQPQGIFDSTLPTPAFGGAVVHYQDSALAATLPGVDPTTYSNLLNFQPGQSYANNPVLQTGVTWTDPYGNLSITVNSATATGLNVTVAYSAPPVCPSAAGSPQSLSAAGGTGTVSVAATATCSWKSAASVPWITLTPAAAQSGSGSVSFTVAPNPDMAPRWGKITVGSAFAIITQAGASGGWMTLSPQTASISAAGGNGTIALASSAPDLTWTMGTDASWITDLECSCYLDIGPGTVRYIVAANPGAERTGHINIGGQVFTVTQAGTGTPSSVTFTQLSPQDAPSARMSLAMAPFGHSGQAILYGGAWDTTFSNVTWLWNGANWTPLNPVNNPGLLAQHAMAYDDAQGKLVLFGGLSGSTFNASNQTWVWDGTNWTQMHPKVSPPARYGHAMAYDALSKKIVLFGGYGMYGESNDTWTWDGSNWTQVTTSESPLPRSGHAMAFDAARGQVVLFGGFLSQPTPTWFSDTWLWDAKGWHQALTPAPPAARFGQTLAYHPALHAVVMIGGYGGKDVSGPIWYYDFRRETWLWNGQTWTQQFPAIQPGPAYTLGAAYDDTKQALTIHVGDDLTCLSRGPKTFLLSGPPQ